jgi:hypothetical protein
MRVGRLHGYALFFIAQYKKPPDGRSGGFVYSF